MKRTGNIAWIAGFVGLMGLAGVAMYKCKIDLTREAELQLNVQRVLKQYDTNVQDGKLDEVELKNLLEIYRPDLF